jgi:hypothetical protein
MSRLARLGYTRWECRNRTQGDTSVKQRATGHGVVHVIGFRWWSSMRLAEGNLAALNDIAVGQAVRAYLFA